MAVSPTFLLSRARPIGDAVEPGRSAVVGMPDPLMGEEVLAFVVLKDGQTASAEEVIAFCQSRIARFKCPKEVRFVTSLPKSPIGKILRKELRRQA